MKTEIQKPEMNKESSTPKAFLEDLLSYEKQRYQHKGYGIIFSTIITLIWFLVIPQTAQFWWPKKIENEGKVYAVISYLNNEFWFIFTNIIFYFIYKSELNFFERYKISDKPWPWNKNPEEWYKTLKDTIKLLLFNQGIMLPLVILPYYIKNESVVRMDYESLPSCFEVIYQTVIFMILEDATFYWSHRFLHLDFIYPYVHKIHHKYVNTISIASEYAHPFEFIFGNILTSNSGILLFGKRTHLLTQMMWTVLRTMETTDGHCGYDFSWSPFRLLPMSAGSEYHNYHHMTFKGNYSSFFTYWDRMFNTINKKYLEFVDKKQKINMKRIEVEIDFKKTDVANASEKVKSQ